jgi:GLTT repeat (6 copies)
VGQENERRAKAACPRCSRSVHEPTAWSSAWRCDLHGEVYPLLPAFSPSNEGLEGLLRTARVPVWLPWPLPAGWLVTGFAGAGDERTGSRASVVALSGPSPLGGLGDLLVVAEEPGTGLGAGLAGLDTVDPGSDFAAAPPSAAALFGNRDVPLWLVDSPDRAVFAGEAQGCWLWLVMWPDTAGCLLIDQIELRDLRDPWQDLDMPFGAPTPRLANLILPNPRLPSPGLPSPGLPSPGLPSPGLPSPGLH